MNIFAWILASATIVLIGCTNSKTLTVAGQNDSGGNKDLVSGGGLVNACNVTPVPTQLFYPGQSQTTKSQFDVGTSSGLSRSITTSDPAGYLVYGPFLKNLTLGVVYKVTFSVRLQQMSTGDDPNDKIASLDVYDARDGGTVLGGRTLRRMEFAQMGAPQDFDMYVYLPKTCGNGIEARVYYHKPPGVSTFELLSTSFTPTPATQLTYVGNNFSQLKNGEISTRNTVGFSAWINTTATSAGVIFGSQNSDFVNTSTVPYGFTPNVLIDNSGKVRGCFIQAIQSLTRPSCYLIGPVVNDGNWHHVALLVNTDSQNQASQQYLVVDGTVAATSNNLVDNLNYMPFNQIGLGVLPDLNPPPVGPPIPPSWKYFLGYIRDARILYAPTLNNVLAIYNSTK